MVKACKSEHLYKTSSFCCKIHSLLSIFPLFANPMMVLKLLCFHLFPHTNTNTSSSGSGAPEKRFCAHKSAKRIPTLAFTMWHLGIFFFSASGSQTQIHWKRRPAHSLHEDKRVRTNTHANTIVQNVPLQHILYVCVSVLCNLVCIIVWYCMPDNVCNMYTFRDQELLIHKLMDGEMDWWIYSG